MYCCNCAHEIDSNAIERKKNSYFIAGESFNPETKIEYICPICNSIIHYNISLQERKNLRNASLIRIYEGKLRINKGIACLVFSLISLIISLILLIVVFNPFITLLSVSFILSMIFAASFLFFLASGLIFLLIGINEYKKYSRLVRDIDNKTLVQ